MSLYNLEGLSEKVGFRSVILKRGEFKDMGSPFREMTDDERKKFDLLADSAYDRFKQVIRDGRGKKLTKDVDQLANGAVITSQEALLDGLIDGSGRALPQADGPLVGAHRRVERAVARDPRPPGFTAAGADGGTLLPVDARGGGQTVRDGAGLRLAGRIIFNRRGRKGRRGKYRDG
jgi:ClpP class serine protease